MLVALAVAALVCAVGSLAVGRLSSLLSHGQRRRTVGIALAGVATLLAASALIARPPAGGPIEWADRQVESFKRFDPRARDSATSVADRLVVSAGSGRWQNWSVAGAQFTEAPLFGTGAGDYSFRWASERDIDISVQNAHSLYLEVLGESGLIGLLLLLTPLGAVVIAVGSALRRRPPFPLARDLGIAIAACGTVALHLAGDWAWQMPAVVIPAVALGAAAIAASAVERGVPPTGPRIIPVAIAAVSAVAILTISSPVAGAFRLADAREHALRGDLPGALRIARDAGDVDPQSPGPYQLEANLLADLDKPRMSDAAFARAMSASPREWSIPADWASALLRRGDARAARPLIRRALALNPREPRLALLRREVGI